MELDCKAAGKAAKKKRKAAKRSRKAAMAKKASGVEAGNPAKTALSSDATAQPPNVGIADVEPVLETGSRGLIPSTELPKPPAQGDGEYPKQASGEAEAVSNEYADRGAEDKTVCEEGKDLDVKILRALPVKYKHFRDMLKILLAEEGVWIVRVVVRELLTALRKIPGISIKEKLRRVDSSPDIGTQMSKLFEYVFEANKVFHPKLTREYLEQLRNAVTNGQYSWTEFESAMAFVIDAIASTMAHPFNVDDLQAGLMADSKRLIPPAELPNIPEEDDGEDLKQALALADRGGEDKAVCDEAKDLLVKTKQLCDLCKKAFAVVEVFRARVVVRVLVSAFREGPGRDIDDQLRREAISWGLIVGKSYFSRVTGRIRRLAEATHVAEKSSCKRDLDCLKKVVANFKTNKVDWSQGTGEEMFQLLEFATGANIAFHPKLTPEFLNDVRNSIMNGGFPRTNFDCAIVFVIDELLKN